MYIHDIHEASHVHIYIHSYMTYIHECKLPGTTHTHAYVLVFSIVYCLQTHGYVMYCFYSNVQAVQV